MAGLPGGGAVLRDEDGSLLLREDGTPLLRKDGDSVAVEFATGGEDRPEVLHQTLMARAAVLEVALQELRSPVGIGIGHNRPPPDEEPFYPVTPDELDEIEHLIVLLKEQPPAPKAVLPQLIEQSRVVSKIGAKIAELADIYAKETVNSAGQETGQRLVQLPFWLGIASAIPGVASALQTWISPLGQGIEGEKARRPRRYQSGIGPTHV